MSGFTDLSLLLATLEPVLLEGEFVYATVPPEKLQEYLGLKPIGLFFEKEGLTLILLKETAEKAELASSAPFRCITMMVHSSLEAVGMTAAMAAALTKEGISANVVAAYYHDHIFVPAADAERAVAALRALSASAR
ncbi:ACT domain-containing protein [Neorhizobium galegae]|uniref:ACT domain-containing protein n=1 Tax=Neorhizobium galegae TaxID=399 RepID=UPI0021006B30|nr:ACT domain-containing protein [Neorhizobium galegae]MCQ1574015.1 ACT domain-containing protein [Neorhizobium galegae]